MEGDNKKNYKKIFFYLIAIVFLIGFCLIYNNLENINKIKELEEIKDEKIVVECNTNGQIIEGICYRDIIGSINKCKGFMFIISSFSFIFLIIFILRLKNEIHKINN
jgi:uncharacterized membrane protein YjfL (UPF0719 family)